MDFKKLLAYQKAFDIAMAIFEISKSFPKKETYSLTHQIRRCSLAVNANMAEAYRKRRCPKHIVSKQTDSDGETSETITWLDFAFACNYLSEETHIKLTNDCIELGKLINYMINNPAKFVVKVE